MGKNKIAPNTAAETDLGVRDITAEEADQLAIREAELIQRYGDGKEFNRERVEGELIVLTDQVRNAYLEIGKKLLFLKAHGKHGEFQKSLERIDIHPRTARNLMKVAKAFLDEHGNVKTATVAVLPPVKLLALARLDDEELAELEDTGEIAGLTKGEIEGMKAKELEARIRDLKKKNKELQDQAESESEVHNQILSEKNEKIDELDRQLRSSGDPARWHRNAEEMLMRLHALSPQYSRMVGEFARLVDEINGMTVGEWEQSQIILLEHARYTLEMFGNSLDGLGRQLDMSAPEGNAVFHALTAYGVVPKGLPAESEAEDV